MKKILALISLLFGIQVIAQNNKPEVNLTSNGNIMFANKMFVKLMKNEKKNFLYSPFSISAALAITYEGSNGKTKSQMANTFNFTSPKLKEDFKQIFAAMEKSNQDGFELNIANALWLQKKFNLLSKYVEVASKYYEAGLDTLDFINDSEGSRKIINEWISKKTNGKIENMIQPGILGELTRLVITNAIYMNAKWETPFDKSRSSDGYFKINNNTDKVITPFMAQKLSAKYYENNVYQAIEIPYANKTASMIIMLPKKNINQMEKIFNHKLYKSLLINMKEEKIDVIIPKFKITSEFELSKLLTAIGMPDAFNKAADFSGMTGKKDLMIDKILHKAFIEINEEGTIAAAATVVVMREKSVPPRKDFKTFIADRPFLFIIKENATDNILFAGKLMNPKE